jgi:hypothetical protein
MRQSNSAVCPDVNIHVGYEEASDRVGNAVDELARHSNRVVMRGILRHDVQLASRSGSAGMRTGA